MAPKKAGKVTTKAVYEEEPAIVFPPTTFLVEDVNTVLGLLVSQEYQIRLRALNTLNKYMGDESCINMFLSRGIYRHLCNLLVDEDVFILRYTLKMLAEIMSNTKHISRINFNDLFSCLNPALRLYLEKEDTFILETASLIMVRLVKYNEVFTVHVYSLRLIERLFEKMRTTRDVDVQKNSVELLYYLLQIKPAEEALPKTEIISLDVLLCLLRSEIKDVRDLALNILVTLASWRNRNVLVKLTEKKINEAMINIIMNEDNDEWRLKAFDVVKTCMSVEDCAKQFCKTVEFIKFSEWIKFCPSIFIERSAEILKILTKIPEIRQIIFDLSIEDTIVSLFRYAYEPIYILACEAVSNMTTYKYCCDKIVTPSLIVLLLDILKTPSVSMDCLEAVMKTLCNFMKRNANTLKILVKLNCFDLLPCLFEKYESEMSHECVEMILDVIIFCAKSKYLDAISDRKIYEMLLHLYECRQHLLKILCVVQKLITNEEFRMYFLEVNGPDVLLGGLENSKCPNLFMHVVIVVQNLIPYKNIALAFLDVGLLEFLNDVDPEIRNKVRVIDEVIQLLYDLCLSLKFFDKGRLEITDLLRDTFYLVHNDWFTENTSAVMVSDESPVVCKPIYVVNYNVLKTFCDSDLFDFTDPSENTSGGSVKQNKGFAMKDTELICAAIHLKQVRNASNLPPGCVDLKKKEASINYGDASDDPYLVEYIMEIHNRFFTSENPITTLQGRVQFLAEYVDKQMSGFEETTNEKRKAHTFQIHLMSLSSKLGSNLIPIGYLRMGRHCERALLFKVLADNFNLPATLSKGRGDIYWNEVAFVQKPQDPEEHKPMLRSNQFIYYVIDLMNDVGNLMPVGSVEALKYCHVRTIKDVTPPEHYNKVK